MTTRGEQSPSLILPLLFAYLWSGIIVFDKLRVASCPELEFTSFHHVAQHSVRHRFENMTDTARIIRCHTRDMLRWSFKISEDIVMRDGFLLLLEFWMPVYYGLVCTASFMGIILVCVCEYSYWVLWYLVETAVRA